LGLRHSGSAHVPLDNPNRLLTIRGFSFEPTHGPGWSVMRSDNGIEDGIGSIEVLSVRRERDATPRRMGTTPSCVASSPSLK
jgi:hypothetical protein